MVDFFVDIAPPFWWNSPDTATRRAQVGTQRMTIYEIEKRLKVIRATRADDEMAHSYEDALHQDVLAAIARGDCQDPAKAAKAALRTVKIDFARWCA